MHPLNRRSVSPFLIFISLLPFALLWRWVLKGEVLYWGTLLLQFWPWHHLAATSALSGEWPLWNPLLGNGTPLLANLQTAFFYPLNLLYLILPIEHGLTLSVGLHLTLAGWFMYLYTRQLGLTPFAAALSGLTYMFSGYLVGRTQFITMINAAAWFPLLLLFSDRLVTRRTNTDILWLSLVLAIQLLAGHAQLWFYGLWLIGPYVVFRSWQKKSTSRSLASNLYPLASVLARLGIAISLALLLTAIQILPTAEFVTQSARHSGAERTFALTYSFWPWRLLTLWSPNFFGHPASGNYWGYANYWEDHAYLGVLPFLLAVIAGWSFVLRQVWGPGAAPSTPASTPLLNPWRVAPFFMALIPISLILAMGWNTPVYLWVFDFVPGFGLFQAPTRLLIWYTLAMAVLAGLGADSFKLTPSGRRGLRRLVVIAIGLIIAGAAGSMILTGRSHTFVEATFTLGLGLAISAGLLLTRPRPHSSTATPSRPHKEIIWQWAILAFVAFDLGWAALPLNPTQPAAIFRQPIANTAFLQNRSGDYRFLVDNQFIYDTKFKHYFRFQSLAPANGDTWQSFKETLTPNLGVYAGLASANNDDPLVVSRWQKWMDLIEKAPPAQRIRLLALMNVGYYLDDTSRAVWPVIYTNGSLAIQQPPETLPRAYFVPQAYHAADENEVIARLTSPDFDYHREVIIMGAKVKEEVPAKAQEVPEVGRVTVTEAGANQLTLKVDAPTAGYVILTDTFYPGWQAFLDDQQVKILPANLAFRAVAVEVGQHQIIYHYRPRSFTIGLWVSAITLLGIVIYMFGKILPRIKGFGNKKYPGEKPNWGGSL